MVVNGFLPVGFIYHEVVGISKMNVYEISQFNKVFEMNYSIELNVLKYHLNATNSGKKLVSKEELKKWLKS
ncbi:MAG: hypothetical protein ACTSR8_19395 [Promethearchaeota archaeon]